MQTITLYRNVRQDGGVDISPIMPDADYTTLIRLVADEGKGITDGSIIANCIDTINPSAWSDCELPMPEDDEEATAEDYEAALAELGVR